MSGLSRWVGRSVVVVVVDATVILLAGAVLPGLHVAGVGAAVTATVAVAVLNALVWPLLVRFAVRLMVLTAGLLALALNAVLLGLASQLVDGFEVDGFGSALVTVLVLATATTLVGAVSSIDDDDAWHRRAARRRAARSAETTDVPGIVILQIDGLSERVLRRAIDEGRVPNLAGWIESGTHTLRGWECDLSSQTGAMQAGILLGDNSDMPAFRWYDKSTGRIMVSNHPGDAAEMEAARRGDGLLRDGGVSRGNVFSGEAEDSMFTFSTVGTHERSGRGNYDWFFSDPGIMARIVVLSLGEIVREIRAARRDRRQGVEPRLDRGGVYPLLRAATTIVLRELTVQVLLGDIARGVPAAYADFVGYDEVAHHSGIERPDSLAVLERTDREIGRLLAEAERAPRPYRLVILSDHGQTQGATFRQRYGVGLDDVVRDLAAVQVTAPEAPGEGWLNLSGLVGDLCERDGRAAAALRRVVGDRVVDGEVVLGPPRAGIAEPVDDEIVVLASGNLGLVYVKDLDGRATREQLVERYPALLAGLASHPGIGFVMARSEEGALVAGHDGLHRLDDGHVVGTDPLLPYGPRAAEHLRRTDGFSNAPDILVMGAYDPERDEGPAFEELIGFHGGLGGDQSRPFLLHPAELPMPDGDIVGAEAVHRILRSWRADLAPLSPA